MKKIFLISVVFLSLMSYGQGSKIVLKLPQVSVDSFTYATIARMTKSAIDSMIAVNNSRYVGLVNNQTISGTKTFNGGKLILQGYDNAGGVALKYADGIASGVVTFPAAESGKSVAYQDWVSATYIASGSSASLQNLSISGTNGNGFIHLKHQASDATTPSSSSVLFANSSGYMRWKNGNDYYSTLAMPQTANRVYTYQDKSYTLADSSDVATNASNINLKVNKAGDVISGRLTIQSLLLNKDSIPITTSNVMLLTLDTATNRVQRIFIPTKLSDTTLTGNYTLQFRDLGRVFYVNSATNVNITIPSGIQPAIFNKDSDINFYQLGVGQIVFVGSGVTVRSEYSANKTLTANSPANIHFVSSTIVQLAGSLTL